MDDEPQIERLAHGRGVLGLVGQPGEGLPVPGREVIARVVALCYTDGMGQPVRISDELLKDARRAGVELHRSASGQIELWASLGRAIEPLLDGMRIKALRQAGPARPLSALLATVESAEGQRRLATVLAERPYPHYAPAPGRPGLLVRTDASGKRVRGRFVGRTFKAAH